MNRLKFEGKGFDFFKIFIVDVLLNIISLSLLYPRSIVREARYLWAEASLGGSPFTFKGSTKSAFNAYMKTLLVVVIFMIIAIIEGLLIGLSNLQGSPIASYLTTCTILVVVILLTPFIMHGDLHFFINNTAWRTVSASYKGKLSEITGINLRGILLSALTLGIYSAWYETQLYTYTLENTRFGSLRFSYNGTSKELFKIYIKGFLLGIVTLGIYNIWNFRDLYNYSVEHTLVRKGEQEFNLHSDANTRDVFEFMVGNALLVVLTLGLGTPWAIIRMFRFLVNHCVVPSAFNIDSIEDNEVDEVPQVPSTHWLDKWNPMLFA